MFTKIKKSNAKQLIKSIFLFLNSKVTKKLVIFFNKIIFAKPRIQAAEKLKEKYLPGIISGDLIGCIGITEPDAGSDVKSIKTKAVDKGDHYLLNGSKTFITNGVYGDFVVTVAKTDSNAGTKGISLIVVDLNSKGINRTKIDKLGWHASDTAEISFDNVKVPKGNLLTQKDGLGAPLGCLDSARYGIAWGAIGAAMDCYDTALRYSKERIQFGKPIGSFQLQQKKLAEMITEITKAQLITWRLGVLRNENKATSAQISMCKRNNVEIALNIARNSRQILGGMGITGEYSIMRHMMNLESVITYEGTHDIHLLITGLDITGLNAFS